MASLLAEILPESNTEILKFDKLRAAIKKGKYRKNEHKKAVSQYSILCKSLKCKLISWYELKEKTFCQLTLDEQYRTKKLLKMAKLIIAQNWIEKK